MFFKKKEKSTCLKEFKTIIFAPLNWNGEVAQLVRASDS